MTICVRICAGSEAWISLDGPKTLTPSWRFGLDKSLRHVRIGEIEMDRFVFH